MSIQMFARGALALLAIATLAGVTALQAAPPPAAAVAEAGLVATPTTATTAPALATGGWRPKGLWLCAAAIAGAAAALLPFGVAGAVAMVPAIVAACS